MLKQINAPAIVVGAYLGVLQGSESPYRVVKYGVLSSEKRIAYALVEHKDRRKSLDQYRYSVLIAQSHDEEHQKYDGGMQNVYNFTWSMCLRVIENLRETTLSAQ